ncbi:alpha beta hydrolase fold family [Tothia fuscella]|uniref:Alpha beta hydrolase fold family n=1 Tax=Tothia fuscella TaxID=1048955 RepID=A0A9P4NWN3_9PEZI|nr:alpha beta hydrolase fold family [Tothia fuscella]
MISNSLSAYIFIRICVLILRLITPLSILYTCLRVIGPSILHVPPLISIIAFAETAFYLLVYLPRAYVLHRPAPTGTKLSQFQRQELFQRCLDTIPDMDYFLNVWFKGANVPDLRRDEIEKWLAWAFFNQDHASHCDKVELDEYVAKLEIALGKQFPYGHGIYQGMRPTIDPVNMQHRPLLYYMFIVGTTDIVCALQLFWIGLRHYRVAWSQFWKCFPFRFWTLFSKAQSPAEHVSYWHRPHTSTTRLPILFIHGIGIGLHTYANFMHDIIERDEEKPEEGQTGIIALEIMPISFRITHTALERDEMVAEILQILEKHGWKECVLVAHSYGTIIATHLLENEKARSRIGPMVLIDPVCLSIHLGDIAFNFAYRSPRKASEHQLHYFACTDMVVAHTITRRFMWTENALWKEEIKGRKVTVVLAGQDIIVDTGALGKYLSVDEDWKSRLWALDGLNLLWYGELNHAQVFDTRKDREAVVDAVTAYSQIGQTLVTL